MTRLAADIKSTCSAVTSEVWTDIQDLTTRLEAVTGAGKKIDADIADLQQARDQHTMQHVAVQRHLEDLSNRGRRHDIRIRIGF